MQTLFRTLLASSLLVLTNSTSNAEQTMGFAPQGPIWSESGPAPIAWGDCIPVPVAQIPFNGVPMGGMGNMNNNAMPMPFPMQGTMMPIPQQAPQQEIAPSFDMPPPSPFYGDMLIPVPSMIPPATAPSPTMPPQLAVNPVCNDDGSQEQLHALQNRYNQAAAASKAKIIEITNAMQDAQNQMTDARVIIGKLSKQQESDQTKIASLEKISTALETEKKGNEENIGKILSYANDLAKLKQDYDAVSKENEKLKITFTKMDNAYRFMESKLAKLTSQQTIGAVTNINSGQSKNIIESLNGKVASLQKENEDLKVTFTKMDNAYRFMESKLAKLESEQTVKAITDINSEQSKGIIESLKAKVSSLSDANKTLQTQLGSIQSEAGAQARKLTALGQSASELTALQSAYKTRNNENDALKTELAKLKSEHTATTLNNSQNKNIIEALEAKLVSLGDTNKTLLAKLGSIQSEAGAQARKLTALGQSASELTALQSAYKTRNNENDALKTELAKLKSEHTAATLSNSKNKNIIEALKGKLISFDNSNKTLQSQLGSLQNTAGAQARKITALGQSATEFTALQSAYKSKNADNEALMLKLIDLNNANKSLQSQLGSYKMEVSSQARKLTALGQSATELTSIQSAYKELLSKNAGLKSDLSVLTSKHMAAVLNKSQNLGAMDKLKQELAKLESFKNAATLKNAQRNNTVVDLTKKLATAEGQRKSCLAGTTTLKTTASNQARTITALKLKTAECASLKSAYDDLNSKKEKISNQLTATKKDLTDATKDSDKDGVLDHSDKCPFSLSGEEVDSIGCLKDTDNDGVADSKDKCASSPVSSHVNEIGCPKISDADSDGVADANDLCANTSAGTTVNNFGCVPTENITLKGVTFKLGSATLNTSSYSILDAAAKTLAKAPDLKVEISGHTDFQGPAIKNKRLSQRRANSVMIYLIRKGVNAKNLSAVGYGEKKPIATNETVKGRATNRRVELKIK